MSLPSNKTLPPMNIFTNTMLNTTSTIIQAIATIHLHNALTDTQPQQLGSVTSCMFPVHHSMLHGAAAGDVMQQ
jgi:hypothetical protein